MITENTVLVLGAGASLEYGFPTGAELTDSIVQLCLDKDDTLLPSGRPFEPGLLNAFATNLRASGVSIDAFLENRPQFLEVGKRAIARVLVSLEDPAQLPLHPRSDSAEPRRENLYDYIWFWMSPTRGSFHRNRLSIVTFNYDRSLEEFLAVRVKHLFGTDADQSRKFLQQIEIIHVHGLLGEHPAYKPEGARLYDTKCDSFVVGSAADKIVVASEQREMTAYDYANERLQAASVVYFLGFHYHESLCRKLVPHSEWRANGKHVFGSAYGLDARQRQDAVRLLGGVQLAGGQDTCLKALRQLVPDPSESGGG